MIRKALPWIAAAVVAPGIAFAEDGVSTGTFTANNVWMMMAAAGGSHKYTSPR